MTECNNHLLGLFSKKHYTYINQIFGDQTVREIISEIFPNKDYDFVVQNTDESFNFSFHHVLKNKKTSEIICSANLGYQDIDININDTLCQSYSLLTYFKMKIDPDLKQRQMDMIEMYRRIISEPNFIKEFNTILLDPKNKRLWLDYTKTTETKNYLKIKNKTSIINNINKTLVDWEQYGYWYFIGKGKCPKPIKSKPTTNKTNITTRSKKNNTSNRSRSSSRRRRNP